MVLFIIHTNTKTLKKYYDRITINLSIPQIITFILGGKDGIIFHGLTNHSCSFASMKHFADNNQRAFQIDNSSCKNIQGVVMEHDPPNTANPCSKMAVGW